MCFKGASSLADFLALKPNISSKERVLAGAVLDFDGFACRTRNLTGVYHTQGKGLTLLPALFIPPLQPQ